MPGAVGAIVAARRRNNGVNRPPAAMNISAERREEMQAEVKKREAIRKLFKRYDTNKSGKLERDQISALLTDLDSTTPAGTPPSEAEIDFILKVADQTGDDCLTMNELEYAVKAWNVYTQRRETMESKMKEFDKSGTGGLEKPELKEYLKSLNGGKDVTDAEVDWVFGEADVFGDGTIHTTELVMATAAWYAHVDAKEAKACCAVL
eukprot:gnl/TRDRNA2_/TRDRNA2_134654_c0_seq1.p1 gnl/TRDRNA2_/TRDRNA2_134654_c0~~gnl/TRDRNA2_/TRDRNA2_134654_c0_seq1.p1  ORF type:complete len:206 (-),score=55.60 gnl/TRDRNA2_/TRDRNA2_134654_c0_seq1:107-724(-)